MTERLSPAHRLFFPLAAAWAAIAVPWWLAMRAGLLPVPFAPAPVLWHMHEMIFGLAGAAIAGFLIARAEPRAMLWLAGSWLLARLAFWLPGPTAPLLLPFYLLLATTVTPRLLRGARKPANLVFALTPLLWFALESIFVLLVLREDAPASSRLLLSALDLLLLMLAIMGGRLLRTATAGVLHRSGMRAESGFAEAPELGLILLFLGAFAAEAVEALTSLRAPLYFAISLLLALHLRRWLARQALVKPEVAVLHLGYASLLAGSLLLALAALGLLPPAGARHFALIGGFGILFYGVAARTAAQRAGQAFETARRAALWSPLLLLAALARLAADLLPERQEALLLAAAVAWALAFLRLLVYLLALRKLPEGRAA